MQNTKIEITDAQKDIITVNGYEGRALTLVISSNEDAQQAANENNELAKRIDMVKAVYKDLCAPAKLMVENGFEAHLETKPGRVIHSQAAGHLSQLKRWKGIDRILSWLIM